MLKLRSKFGVHRSIAFAIVLTLIAASGCTNGSVATKSVPKNRTSGSLSGGSNLNMNVLSPYTLTDIRTQFLVSETIEKNNITRVPVSVVDARITYATSQDLIKDCGSDGSNCQCIFGIPNGGSTSYVTDAVISVEPNLIRCSGSLVDQIPGQLSLMIEFTTLGSVTNASPFTMGASAISLTDPAAYNAVVRHQCYRDTLIPNINDLNLIDPIQSNDPANIVRFNYYTTNLGKSAADYASRSPDYGFWANQINPVFRNPLFGNTPNTLFDVDQYHCPEMMGYRYATDDGATDYSWISKALFWKVPVASGKYWSSYWNLSNSFFPLFDPRPLKTSGGATGLYNSDSRYRSWTNNENQDFWLASRATGVFAEPVFAMTFPLLINDLASSGQNATPINPIQSIGFAVKPKSDGNGATYCPDRADIWGKETPSIPGNYRWRKLWQAVSESESPFIRKMVRPEKTGYYGITDAFCNPGTWNGGDSIFKNKAVFSACATSIADSTASSHFYESTPMARYYQNADRCVLPTGLYKGSTISSYSVKSTYFWQGNSAASYGDVQKNFASTANEERSMIVPAKSVNFDQAKVNDYLFLVTDPGLSEGNLRTDWNTKYTPLRLKSYEECKTKIEENGGTFTPDAVVQDLSIFKLTGSSVCTWVTYSLATAQVETNPVVNRNNQPGGVAELPAAFPLCVLQPNDERMYP